MLFTTLHYLFKNAEFILLGIVLVFLILAWVLGRISKRTGDLANSDRSGACLFYACAGMILLMSFWLGEASSAVRVPLLEINVRQAATPQEAEALFGYTDTGTMKIVPTPTPADLHKMRDDAVSKLNAKPWNP